MEIYVDGSYSKNYPNIVGYGIVIVIGDQVVELSGFSKEEVFTEYNNVGGELLAVMLSIGKIVEAGVRDTDLDIYYDYKGIKSWVTGEWQARKTLTRVYVEFMQKRASEFNLRYNFHKVKAHSGNKYNDFADSLAKLGVQKGIDQR